MQKQLHLATFAACTTAIVLMLGVSPAQSQGLFPWNWGKKPAPQQPPPQSNTPYPRKSTPAPRQGGGRPTGGGAYRTLCVRTCDGFFFPISFKAGRSKFKKDSEVCVQQCGGIGRLFVHRNPGGKINNAVDLDGKRYVDLENAFRYRKEFVAGCDCKGASFSAPAFDTTVEANQAETGQTETEPALKTFPEDGGAAPRTDKLPGAPGSGAAQ